VAGERGLRKQASGIVLMKSDRHEEFGEHEKRSGSSTGANCFNIESLQSAESELLSSTVQASLHWEWEDATGDSKYVESTASLYRYSRSLCCMLLAVF
jgi:hypothetical protein